MITPNQTTPQISLKPYPKAFQKELPAFLPTNKSSKQQHLFTMMPYPIVDNTTSIRNRSRNIIWFNPPYSINVKTNIAKSFLNTFPKPTNCTRYLTETTPKLATVAYLTLKVSYRRTTKTF